MSELGNMDNLTKSLRELAKIVKSMSKDFKSMDDSAARIIKVTGKGGTSSGKSNQMSGSLADFSYVTKKDARAGNYSLPTVTDRNGREVNASTSPFGRMNRNPEIYRGADGSFGPASPAQFAANYNQNVERFNRRQAGAFGVSDRSFDTSTRRGRFAQKYAGNVYSAYSKLSPEGQQFAQGGIYGPADTLNLFTGLSNSLSTFMPSVQDTMDRATSLYNAGTYAGGMSRGDVANKTSSFLANAMTSKGSDARVAQFLSARGMTIGSETYGTTLKTVANAAKYMNISNEEAAASVEGLTNASGAAEMLRNFGIYTADLQTGKEKSQSQIFEELAQRLTAGRGNATVEQTQASIRRGALGVTVDNFFKGDEQGAQMFKQYMIDRAGGNTGGLSGATPGGAAKNPLAAQMAAATSSTAALNQAQDSYIKGIERATQVLNMLNAAAGGLSTVLGGATSLLQTLSGADTVQGMVGGVSTMVNFASKGITSVMSLMSEAGPMTPLAAPIAATIGASAGASLIGAGLAFGAAGIFGGTGGGSGERRTSMPIGGIGGGSVASMFDTSHQQGHRINEDYGTNRGSKKHGGIDYNYSYGEPVKAIGDGKVIIATSGKKQEVGSGSFGNNVKILHESGDGKKYTSMYAHLSSVAVSVGDMVTKGQIIGYAGNSGDTRPAGKGGTHLHFELREGVQIFGGAGKWVDLSQANSVLSSGAVSDTGGSSAPSGSASDRAVEDFKVGMGDVTKMAGNMQSKATKGLGMLRGLYSGDTDQILDAVKSMSSGVGINGDMWNYFTSNPSSTTSSPTGYSGYTPPTTPAKQTNNTVNIVVQVPDASAGEALKFSQLVKQYLDEDSLLSNTRSS